MQHAIRQAEWHVHGCDCRHDDAVMTEDATNLHTNTTLLPPIPSYYARYVWATGGHSAAAAHGNLYNESYTAYMERDVKTVFASIGIDFEGRNYAMGGTG